MKPGLFSLLDKTAGKLAPSPKHQEALDGHFSSTDTARWKQFRQQLRSKGFLSAVLQDSRSNAKLKRYAQMMHQHINGKGESITVPGNARSYTVKFHPEKDRFSCSCPDWAYKRSHKPGKYGLECKHIKQVKLELDAQGIPKEELSKTAANVMRAMHQIVGARHAMRRLQKDEGLQKAKVVNQAYQETFPHDKFHINPLHGIFKHAAVVRGRAAQSILEG